jgi:hypothetical protein
VIRGRVKPARAWPVLMLICLRVVRATSSSIADIRVESTRGVCQHTHRGVRVNDRCTCCGWSETCTCRTIGDLHMRHCCSSLSPTRLAGGSCWPRLIGVPVASPRQVGLVPAVGGQTMSRCSPTHPHPHYSERCASTDPKASWLAGLALRLPPNTLWHLGTNLGLCRAMHDSHYAPQPT